MYLWLNELADVLPKHTTAPVAVDSATEINGCLEMASDYLQFQHNPPMDMKNPTILPYHSGGPRNGEICSQVAERLKWSPIEAAGGDIILFDSFVPHRSNRNRSAANRRMLFFTFNPASEGFHYEAYYYAKRTDPDHLMFHVSTPDDLSRKEHVQRASATMPVFYGLCLSGIAKDRKTIPGIVRSE